MITRIQRLASEFKEEEEEEEEEVKKRRRRRKRRGELDLCGSSKLFSGFQFE